MIDHIGIEMADVEAARDFYTKALAPLGYNLLMEVPKEFTAGRTVLGFGSEGKPEFWISEGENTKPRLHIAFSAANNDAVKAFYNAALAAGAKDNGAPGPRPHYHENYFGAFVIDPEGHNIEAVCHNFE